MSATGELTTGCDHAQSGATLLEMLVVVAVLGLVATLSAASFRPALRTAALASARGQLVLNLARTRAAAMREGRSLRLEPLADGSGYTAAGRVVTLPSGMQLEANPTGVTYRPDGLSSGARLRLRSGRRQADVTIPADRAEGRD